MNQNIHLITFGVEDLERSVAFYEGLLGWRRSPASQGDMIFFSLSGLVFGLYPRAELAGDAGVDAAGSGFRGFTISFLRDSEAAVDELFSLLRAKAPQAIAKPASKAFWGGYSGYLRDPDGNLIEVAFNPFWTLEQDIVRL